MNKAQHVLDHILICGLGSIGRRHLRVFRSLGVRRVDAWRTGKSSISYGGELEVDQSFQSLDEALAESPQAVIIANPTSLHVETAHAALSSGAHLLIEKPLGHRLQGCEDLLGEAERKGCQVVVGCNLRFHPLLQRVASVLDSGSFGRPLLARIHFGAYLPDWHPWEDFRKSYAARADLGGGSALTHIHEIDYAVHLFGDVERVQAEISRHRPLGTDVDESSVALLRHRSGTLSVMTLSLAQRPPTRTLRLTCEGGTLSLDWIEHCLELRPVEGKQERLTMADFDFDTTYIEQACAFMNAAGGERVSSRLCTGREALAALEVSVDILGASHE